jgi:hypothetical protein
MKNCFARNHSSRISTFNKLFAISFNNSKWNYPNFTTHLPIPPYMITAALSRLYHLLILYNRFKWKRTATPTRYKKWQEGIQHGISVPVHLSCLHLWSDHLDALPMHGPSATRDHCISDCLSYSLGCGNSTVNVNLMSQQQ